MKLILIGSPGVGKGTYASRLQAIYHIPNISTGDLFRTEAKQNTPLGKQAKKYMVAGDIVPDDITIEMLKKRIKLPDAKKGFMLDGFPRTIPQAEALNKITKIDAAINYVADDKVIIGRLSGRRTCRKCGSIYHIKNIPTKKEGICDKCGGEIYQRDDDKPAAIKERLKVYHEKTKPVLAFYKKEGILHEVDANIDANDPKFHVIEDTQKILNKIK